MASRHHASHTRTAHHHAGRSEHHSKDCSSEHKSHRHEHIGPHMHTAGSEPGHHLGGSQPKAKEPAHNK